MKKAKYDVFVSYRRTAYDTANLIAEKLRHAGYRVFFDIDTLTSGKFNEQLLDVIAGCKDFILVLPENALERCSDENDWIRREITCAIENKKNIIPVMLDGFSWPSELPKGMEELRNYQAIAAVNREFFDMAVTRLKSYLKSKPSFPLKSWLMKATIVVAVLLVFLGVGFGIINHMAKVTCKEIAVKQASVMSCVDLLAGIRKDLAGSTESLFTNMEKYKDKEDRNQFENDMMKIIGITQKDLISYQKKCPVPNFQLNWIENFVLSFRGLQAEELNAFSAYYESFYEDFEEIIEFLKETIDTHDYSSIRKQRLTTDLNCMQYSINGFYYGYLQILSLLPKSVRKTHYEMAGKWRNYPNGTPLDLPQEEYEQFQIKEIEHYKEEVEQYGSQINYEEQKLNDLEKQIDEENKAFED